MIARLLNMRSLGVVLMLIVVVFGNQSNPGLAKLCTEEMVTHLDECLAREGSAEEVANAIQGIDLQISQSGALFQPVQPQQ